MRGSESFPVPNETGTPVAVPTGMNDTLRFVFGIASLSTTLFTAACSSSSPSGTPGLSGVDADKTMGELDDDERARLCDWGASQIGGYGQSKDAQCGSGTSGLSSESSQSACIAKYAKLTSSCPVTVKQVEDCEVDRLADLCAPEPVSCVTINQMEKQCAP